MNIRVDRLGEGEIPRYPTQTGGETIVPLMHNLSLMNLVELIKFAEDDDSREYNDCVIVVSADNRLGIVAL